MSQPTRPVAELVDFSGGLNSAEPPDQIGANQLADLRNLEYRRTRGLKRRRGSTLNLTNATSIFAASSSVVSLFRHTPGQSETSMELWGMSNDTTPELGRVAAGSAWASVALGDAISAAADAWYCRGISFNGKLFLFYNSAVDRMHVWSGSSVRRMGLPAPGAAPTVANTGAGAYAAVLRYYKVQFYSTDGVGNLVFSPLSDAVSFTPSGAGTAARVTRPTAPGEHETDWLLYASPDGDNYYRIASVAVATTTFDDSTAPTGYAAVAPTAAGFPTQSDYFTPAISAKFGLVVQAQLLLGGSHETTGLSSTIYYTPALNTTGYTTADDERVPSTNRIEVDPQLGGGLTGLGGPIDGVPFAFKISRTYALDPTNDVTLPFIPRLISDVVGCISYQGIVLAEDENGAPALYWPAVRGIYRYGAAGLEYCGLDIEDLWSGISLSATYNITASYHQDAGQVWFFLPVGGGGGPATIPNRLVKFHVQRGRRTAEGVRGGWTRDDGNLASSSAVCMFSDTPGATMGLRLLPYTAKVASGGLVYASDYSGSNQDDDNAVAFTSYLITRAIRRGLGTEFGVQQVIVQGVAESTPVTLDVALRKDFAASDSVTAQTVTFQTTRSQEVPPGLELSECDVVQVRIADQSALNQHWSVDAIGLRYRDEAPKGA